ncbi:MAG: hypothetical protein Q4A70_00085 [Candidatus Saccharibacteria bacterium]|nr:hypothetical protein [Candidatus Saccharibacteria bacterium]
MTDKKTWTLSLNGEEKEELMQISESLTSFRDPTSWLEIADKFGKHNLKEASQNVSWALDNYIKALDIKIEAGEKRLGTLSRVMEILRIEKEKPTWIKQEQLKRIKTRIEKLGHCLERFRQAKASLLDTKRAITDLEQSVLKTLEINNQYIEQICADVKSLCD